MNRFLFDPVKVDGDKVLLSKEESRHISRSLRLLPGAEIELFDGGGTVFNAEIVEIGRRVKVRLGHCVSREVIPGKPVWVLQGLLKGKKMDTVVQKCTELGAARFNPFISSRCQVKSDKTQNNRRQERWQRITIAACKQCLRTQPLIVDQAVPFAELFDSCEPGPNSLRLLFWEEEKAVRLHDLPSFDQFDSVCLLLGPEGGLTLEEVELARERGWQTVSLGDHILRAETATLSALSIVQYLAGNI
jgi:16S rRNA (uracil1498-N3)-methyltransferase